MKSAVRVVAGLILSLTLFSTGCGRKESGAHDPGGPGAIDTDLFYVSLTVSPNPADKFEVVTIDGSASHGGLVSFKFDFGDGSPVASLTTPTTTHAYDVVNLGQDSTYIVKLEACDAEGRCDTAGASITIKDLPPSVASVNPGADGRGVIGEWILLEGKNFLSEPVVTVGGAVAEHVEVIDDAHIRFRVPTGIGAGPRPLLITFNGYEPFTGSIDVRRFAVVTSAGFNKAYVFDVTNVESFVDTGIRLDIDDASVIKISPEGSTAYINNGRFAFLGTGTVQVVDLTANGAPAVIDEFDVGAGPLFDIEVSPKRPLFVAGDALGIHLFDSTDPQTPAGFNYVSALFSGDPLNDVAAVDIAINQAGTRVAVLNAFNNQARIFTLAGNAVTNALNPVRVNCGPGTQDAAMSDDGSILYVLGGGGEGAFPPILGQPTLSTVTAINADTGAIYAGPYNLAALNGGQAVTPIPFDLAVSRTNPHKIYVTTLDEGFSEMFDLLEQVFNGDLSAILDLIIFLSNDGLSFGATYAINNAHTNLPSLGAPMQQAFTAPTSAELLYNDKRMLQSSFRVWYDDNQGDFIFQTGATVINTQTNQSSFIPLETEVIGLNALFNLFQPPFSFGDVSIQP